MTERRYRAPAPSRGRHITNLQKQIELLEEQGNNSELIALLACDPETRGRNRLLADILREEAQTLLRQVRAIAA